MFRENANRQYIYQAEHMWNKKRWILIFRWTISNKTWTSLFQTSIQNCIWWSIIIQKPSNMLIFQFSRGITTEQNINSHKENKKTDLYFMVHSIYAKVERCMFWKGKINVQNSFALDTKLNICFMQNFGENNFFLKTAKSLVICHDLKFKCLLYEIIPQFRR